MAYGDDESVSLGHGKVIGATARALRIQIGDEVRWIPRSVLHDDSEVFDDGENSEGDVLVQLWFAEKEGLA